jgi:hypothetical protein
MPLQANKHLELLETTRSDEEVEKVCQHLCLYVVCLFEVRSHHVP